MRRPAALLLSVLLLAGCLSGCRTLPDSYTDEDESSLPEPVTSSPSDEPLDFTLGSSADEPLTPSLTSTRIYLALAPLHFDGLTELDAKGTPQMLLASAVSQDDPLHPVVTLRSDAVFSDGSPVTAEDVAASFINAKASSNYKALLSNITDAVANGSTITFTLVEPDPQFAACLSFPILKAGGTGGLIGSGPYMLESDPDRLVRNPYAAETEMETIQLRHITDDETLLYSLESSTISFYFNDLSSGEIPRISNANSSIPLNYLVFIGIRSQQADLDDPLVRQALDAALDRNAIVESAFAGRAQPAVTPFSPTWEPAVELKGFSAGENLAVAVAQLEQAGYNTKSGEAAEGKALSLSLLYCGGNSFRQSTAKLLQEQFAKAGVTLELVDVSYDEYVKKLAAGEYDLYLGEIKLSANMSLSPFFKADGGAAYGISSESQAAAAYRQYLAGECTLQEFCDAFTADVPFIPLCYRNGIVAYDRNMSGVSSTAFNLFYGIQYWLFAAA